MFNRMFRRYQADDLALTSRNPNGRLVARAGRGTGRINNAWTVRLALAELPPDRGSGSDAVSPTG
jgi:hypothetical protein